MNILLVFAYLFFIGSVFGWVLEVFFRRIFSSPEHKWVNPGFCTGPYLPIYGFGLSALYGISLLSDDLNLPIWFIIVLIVVCMTLIEYMAGIICLRMFKLRLWDYSTMWGNVQGLICPLYSLFWGVLGAFYLFVVHKYIINAVIWLSQNLAFSFFIGFFFGVFTLDVIHSANLVSKIKRIVNDGKYVVYFEQAKQHIHKFNEEHQFKTHFIRFFRSEVDLSDILKTIYYHDKGNKHIK